MRPAAKAVWVVTMRAPGKKTRIVNMPGGLSEAEARRCACLKLGAGWWPLYCLRNEVPR